MNSHLMEIVAREIVAALPDQKRILYQYIENMENSLAERCQTSEQFMSLLVKHAPHEQAAKHFNIPREKIIMMMREIEKEIDHKLNEKLKNVQWIDRTEETRAKKGDDSNRRKYFLFVM